MNFSGKHIGAGTAVFALFAGAAAVPLAIPAGANGGNGLGSNAEHVLLISVDGLHQSDVNWYVSNHPGSVLANLVTSGADFTNASTTIPSDSFPGMVAQVTGGGPSTTGIYYDDSYNHSLLPAGTTNCAGAKPGQRSPTSSSLTSIFIPSTPGRDFPDSRTTSSI